MERILSSDRSESIPGRQRSGAWNELQRKLRIDHARDFRGPQETKEHYRDHRSLLDVLLAVSRSAHAVTRLYHDIRVAILGVVTRSEGSVHQAGRLHTRR